jgi:hypothetical protein
VSDLSLTLSDKAITANKIVGELYAEKRCLCLYENPRIYPKAVHEQLTHFNKRKNDYERIFT